MRLDLLSSSIPIEIHWHKDRQMTEVPFSFTKYEKEQFDRELARFVDLYAKYNKNINEVLEFARLYQKFIINKHKKWE